MLVKILAETQREKNGAYKRHKKTALNQWTDKEPRKRRLKTTQKTALNSGPGEYFFVTEQIYTSMELYTHCCIKIVRHRYIYIYIYV